MCLIPPHKGSILYVSTAFIQYTVPIHTIPCQTQAAQLCGVAGFVRNQHTIWLISPTEKMSCNVTVAFAGAAAAGYHSL